jgi:hypothetical protein
LGQVFEGFVRFKGRALSICNIVDLKYGDVNRGELKVTNAVIFL